ncbi:amidohydrolase [Coralloluteibacterium stylophorae]|uniref:Amidohydrolase n=1 Tax=Coralloluteibacterium stylophorae TaxID=1776034 RepID=A0A8J7VSI2_9GAMM|nr:amidohydrolase [Coralloluteibacterium stylophorae]MBS7458018.1 amidohydrolase [Coralloluteibacterium stylophorae]
MKRLALAGLAVLACSTAAAADRQARADADAYPSTYAPIAAAPTLIRGATVLTGTGTRLDGADVLIVDGRIAELGRGLRAPAGAREIDGAGKWVTPGIIDVHSHLGVYPSPGLDSLADGNEMSAPDTAQVWAEHSVWPQDPGFNTARAGGVTTLQILPGSANLFGGRSVVLKNVPAVTYQGMKFPDAQQGLKMACGENPKRVYGEGKGQAPMTRMGNVAGYRAAFAKAAAYKRKRDAAAGNGDDDKDPPERDLQMDTLAGVLDGDIRVHIHCYRADEMATMIDLSKEFGFQIAAFHHGVEAYKLADRLAQERICGALWADWWGFKMEAYDGIQENIALVDRPPNGCAIVHSDSEEGIQRLNQEAGKVMGRAARIGMPVTPEHAIQWLTLNAARSLGIDDRTGTLEAGKMGDVVVWDRDPFSVYAHAEKVFVDGALLYDRDDPARQPVSDFMLGQEGVR